MQIIAKSTLCRWKIYKFKLCRATYKNTQIQNITSSDSCFYINRKNWNIVETEQFHRLKLGNAIKIMRMHQNNNLLLIFCLFFWRARVCWCTTNLATHVLYLAAHLPKLAAHLPNLADHRSNLAPNLPSFTYNQRWETKQKQIRKFLCLFRYRKFANFLGVPVRANCKSANFHN